MEWPPDKCPDPPGLQRRVVSGLVFIVYSHSIVCFYIYIASSVLLPPSVPLPSSFNRWNTCFLFCPSHCNSCCRRFSLETGAIFHWGGEETHVESGKWPCDPTVHCQSPSSSSSCLWVISLSLEDCESSFVYLLLWMISRQPLVPSQDPVWASWTWSSLLPTFTTGLTLRSWKWRATAKVKRKLYVHTQITTLTVNWKGP